MTAPGPGSGGPRDLEPAIWLRAEAAQLRDELAEAVPHLPPAVQVEARQLLGGLEHTLATLGFALMVVTAAEPPPLSSP